MLRYVAQQLRFFAFWLTSNYAFLKGTPAIESRGTLGW
jgi:hypothetical protein